MELDFDAPAVLGRYAQFYHVGIACRELEPAMEQIGKLFSVKWALPASGDAPNLFTPGGAVSWSARKTMSVDSRVPIELLEGSTGSTWDTGNLAVTHHAAYWSADVRADIAELESEGWSTELTMLDTDGNPMEFAYMSKPGLTRIELVGLQRLPAYLALREQP
jgi:hypothetical protein